MQMEKTVPELMAAISPEEWAQVPESVLELIHELVRRMDKLEQEMVQLKAENELLKEQLARNSANSSQPPSKNPLTFKPNRKEPTGKKRGGQIGHIGHERKLYPLEMVEVHGSTAEEKVKFHQNEPPRQIQPENPKYYALVD